MPIEFTENPQKVSQPPYSLLNLLMALHCQVLVRLLVERSSVGSDRARDEWINTVNTAMLYKITFVYTLSTLVIVGIIVLLQMVGIALHVGND